MIKIAIYDLDRTITRQATYTAFLLYAAARLRPWRLALAPLFLAAMLVYAGKLISRRQLKQFGFRCLIGSHIRADVLARIGADFAVLTEQHNIAAGARAQIAADKASGHKLLMATAAAECYARPLAERLGFDDVVATRNSEARGEWISAKIAGENCYGAEKLRRIAEWLVQNGIERSAAATRFYSDHGSDAETFRWADEAVVINPSAKLRERAKNERWSVRHFT